MKIDFNKKQTAEQLATEKLRQEMEAKAIAATQYLRSTDWYIIRKLETSEPIPDEISSKRAEARSDINAAKSPG